MSARNRACAVSGGGNNSGILLMKKRKVIAAGITVAIISLVVVGIIIFRRKTGFGQLVGGMSDACFSTIGTVQKIGEDGSMKVRPHGKEEDYNYEYKSILHYIQDKQLELVYSSSARIPENLETGDVVVIYYFTPNEDERPLKIDSLEILGKENPNSNISRENFVSVEGTILDMDSDPNRIHVWLSMPNSSARGMMLYCNWELEEPEKFYKENQRVRIYYEPPRTQEIPHKIYIGSYEEQIVPIE